MKPARISRILPLVSLAVFAFAIVGASGSPDRQAQSAPGARGSRCTLVSGTVMTNFGGFDQNTTLGTATGDLRGAVTGTILGSGPGPTNNTMVFQVQHHWVTETGDTLSFDPATATVVPVPPSQTLFAIVTYPVHLNGGTGKFAGATGDLANIGEVDLSSGTVFRYSGQVCFAGQE